METAITNKVYPAYQKLIDYFHDILPKTTTDDGVWKLPDGDAFYAYKLHENTTTTLNPTEVHELGLREVSRIEGEMRTILDANGFAGQPIGEAMDKLAKDPRFLYSNDDKGRAAALARYTELIKQATDRSSKELFVTTPRAKIEVRRVPEFKEATAPGANYDIAAMDGSRPGIFFANLRDMNEVPKWSMPTLAYTRAFPVTIGNSPRPRNSKAYHDFVRCCRSRLTLKAGRFTANGWRNKSDGTTTIHSETWDASVTSFFARFGWSSIRASMRSIGRAIRRSLSMREKTGMGEKEVKSEIERYIVAPGQACAYKIGMLRIQELRLRAQKELGDKFNQREFHDAVLKNGALPLEILEEQVNEYIQQKKA